MFLLSVLYSTETEGVYFAHSLLRALWNSHPVVGSLCLTRSVFALFCYFASEQPESEEIRLGVL